MGEKREFLEDLKEICALKPQSERTFLPHATGFLGGPDLVNICKCYQLVFISVNIHTSLKDYFEQKASMSPGRLETTSMKRTSRGNPPF